FTEVAAEIEKESPVGNWVLMDGSGEDTAFERIMTTAEPIYEMIDLSPDDLAMIMYSSGTTGRPKGVTLNHENMLFGGVFNGLSVMGMRSEAVGYSVLPLFHIGGTNGFSTSTLYSGGTTILDRSFDPGRALEVIGDKELGVTHFLGVPAMYNAMKAHPASATTDFSGLDIAMAGAEAVPEPMVRWWLEERGLLVQEVYGMTETCGGTAFLVKADMPDKIGSSGKALRHTQFKIVDPETLEEVPVGAVGEIWMRGPNIMPGYWNRPEANAETLVDGWLRSGDVGRIDAEGFVYVEDRVKDMYISGGENVYPAEVESVLYGIDAIGEVAVIGVPDSQWGEVGCAVVALKDGAELTITDLCRHCEGKLAHYKQPVHMAVVEALPRNATGKVLKFQLRKSVPETLELR
ncbi:MAG: AMP-binding protein, partial [Maricaulaceae bacterium]